MQQPTVYEDDDLKGQILASKAMAIVQQTLTSGSVLFSFRKGLFGDRVDAYKTTNTKSLFWWNFVL
ncbi:unnamed protein product [Mucor fragilis]